MTTENKPKMTQEEYLRIDALKKERIQREKKLDNDARQRLKRKKT